MVDLTNEIAALYQEARHAFDCGQNARFVRILQAISALEDAIGSVPADE